MIGAGNHSVFICSFYRPPGNDINPLIYLREPLETLYNKESSSSIVILGGDFNLPAVLWNGVCGYVNTNPVYGLEVNKSLIDIANDYHLEQLAHENTRENNILDLLFCSHPTKISKVSVVPGISDHEAIYFHFNLKSLSYRNNNHNIYLYHKGDFDGIKKSITDFPKAFLSSNPYDKSIEQNWLAFKNVVNQAVQKYIPQKQAKSSKHIPWLNKSIKSKMKERKHLYDIAKKTKSIEAWKSYQRLRNRITKEIEIAHTDHQSQLFTDDSNNTCKRFWKYIKSSRKDHIGVPTLINNGKVITDSLEKAEALNNQFYSVFTDEDLFDLPQLDQLEYPMMPEISFSISGIHSLLLNLDSNKSPGPDSMTTIILKKCADEVSPILQVVFTQSMNSGTLPDDWLSANITPVYKKNDRANVSNYRPISLTAICCKVMEHIIYHSVMEHLNQHNILNRFQYGFRRVFLVKHKWHLLLRISCLLWIICIR